MVGCRELDLNSNNTAELIPERQYELGATVRYNRLWGMPESVDLLDKQLSYASCVSRLVAQYRDRILTESVDKDKYYIITILVLIELLEIY
jgi:hypothetical protein